VILSAGSQREIEITFRLFFKQGKKKMMKKQSMFNGLMVCVLIMAMPPVSGPLAAPVQAQGTKPFAYIAAAGNNVTAIDTSRNSVAPTVVTGTTSLTGVVITGRTTGTVSTTYTFMATASPITATLPITYTWQADGQSPVTHVAISGLTDIVTFTWPSGVSGTQAITVTAANAGPEVVTGTAAIHILLLFSEVSAGLPGVWDSSAAWGDYDNDGWLDILLTGDAGGVIGGEPYSDYIARVYHNNGDGSFTNIGAGLPGVGVSSAAWGDYDNDGWLDILLTGLTAGWTSIARVYHNNGDGTFTDIGAGLPGVSGGSVAWGDYDNDGWLDILLTGSGIARVYHNNRHGAFIDIGAGLPGTSGSVAWGDYDNDGRLDILLTGDATGVYHSNQDGTFTNIGADLTAVIWSSVAWGDYDNDGWLDILLTGNTGGSNSNNIATVYHNNGNGTFTDIDAGLPGACLSSVAWGDYDSDGRLDILLTGTITGSKIISKVYHNDGNGAFTDIGAGLPGAYQSSVAWGDYDNDGWLDILLTGSYIAKVYHNNTSAINSFSDVVYLPVALR
jgi:uncharacterized membrane protein YeaQ/YmgE (transglycosylase-associated protein family)